MFTLTGDTVFKRVVFTELDFFTNSGAPLLTVGDNRVTVEDSIFINLTGVPQMTGMVFSGDTTAEESVVTRSDFVGLEDAIDVYGGMPKISYNNFFDSQLSHIHIGPLGKQDPSDETEDLSDVTDPERPGYNKFDDSGSGDKVINDRDETIKMENNDWDTDDLGEVDAAIDGPADFEPILGSGSSVLAGSLFVTVVDGETADRVLTASVDLQVSPFAPVTENEGGVYTFAAVTPNTYTVTVTADGYENGTDTVNVGDGELVSVAIALGGGAKGGACGRASASGMYSTGDLLILILILGILLGYRAVRARGV